MTEYTKKADEALEKAGKYAKQLHAPYLGTEHLLAGLWLTDSSVGKVLHDAFSFESLELLMNVTVVAESGKRKLSKTPELEEVLAEAGRIAESLGSGKTGTAHLMLGILRRRDCIAVRLLNSLHISLQRMTKDVLNCMDLSAEEVKQQVAASKEAKKNHAEINEVCTDLTAKAEEGLLDPVI